MNSEEGFSVQQIKDMRRLFKRAKSRRRPEEHISPEVRGLRETVFNSKQRRFLTLLLDISIPLYEIYSDQLGDKFRKLENLK